MIDSASIEGLKSTLDIVDVVGNYIELKKAGANYKANCPFHDEKTPSFVVSPSKQIYHCFGCGAGGDAIKFVMDIEKLSYPEAVEKLASTYNYTLRYTKSNNGGNNLKRVLDTTQNWYTKNLDLVPFAREYLKNRGINQNSIEKFGIGYATSSNAFIDFLHSHHIPLTQALEAGTVARDDNGRYYARLIERITFPIHSTAGAIVGFGGRTLTNHPAKYINSPQTKLFNKSRLLFGYHLAKDAIYRQKEIVVCEGYLDVIMMHQIGFNNSVATLGTALTADHLPLLHKGNPKVILAYDGDSAGVNAALKASKLLASHSFEGGVVLFLDNKDPADMALGDKQGLAELISHPTPFIEFVITQIAHSYNISNPYEKEKAFLEIKNFLNTLSPILQDSYIPLASSILSISPQMFGTRRDNYPKRSNNSKLKQDPAWLSLIKTMIQNSELIDEAIDILPPHIAGVHQEAYKALIRGDTNHPDIIRVSIDENIPVLDDKMFHKTIITQLKRYYKQLLSTIAKSSIEYEKKSWLIRKIRTDILPRLEKGELVPYESNITI